MRCCHLYAISARTQLPLSRLHMPDSSWKHCPESPSQTTHAENSHIVGTDSRNKSGLLKWSQELWLQTEFIVISQLGKTTKMFAFPAQPGFQHQPVLLVPSPPFRGEEGPWTLLTSSEQAPAVAPALCLVLPPEDVNWVDLPFCYCETGESLQFPNKEIDMSKGSGRTGNSTIFPVLSWPSSVF